MSIERWLKDSYNIKLVLMSGLEYSGYYLHEEKIMFVNSCLNENEIVAVVLHELGHHLKDEDVIGSYTDFVARSKMEYHANYYMLDHLLDQWCATTGIDVNDINYVTFLEANNLSLKYIPIVEKVLSTKNRQPH